ncbi:MAG: betaine--homocysteine S-methyltransferase [Rhodobacteraceae bacterium]|nr:betaine--homocysteine S-methyltransferase [Paracoccaceae bacterium]
MSALDGLHSLLRERGWVLADGATGTNLFAAGLSPGEAPELWNDSHPQRIKALIASFVAAGVDIVLTNSFGCNARRLKLHAAESKTVHLARLAAEIAREAADAGQGNVVVAGSVGPTGDLIYPVGELTEADAREIFFEQISGLKRGGADVIWIETMSDLCELEAAAAASVAAGMPWCATMSFDSSGRTMMGIDPGSLNAWVGDSDPPPEAFGANCGVGSSDLVRTVLEMAAAAPPAPIIAKANAGIPKYTDGRIHYDGTPDLMADFAELSRNAGASIIGGCCGTTSEHLLRMRRRLESVPTGSTPEVEEITRRLGPLTPPAPTGGRRRKPRRSV